MLSAEELRRYNRHILLPEVGLSGQRRLKAGRVLLVGAGGLGSPVALYLAAAGVGRIGIVDGDVVEETNLQRQVLFATSAVGRPKAEMARERLAAVNPYVQLQVYPERLSRKNARGLFSQYDVIVDGTDNFATRYLINDAAVLEGRPVVHASVFRFEGQLSVFHHAGGPCYRCLFPDPPAPGAVPDCSEAGVLGVLPGILGTMQAAEVLKILVGVGEVASGRLLIYDGLAQRLRELGFQRNPACPVCGEHPTIQELVDYEEFCGVSTGRKEHSMDEQWEISVQGLKQRLDNGESFTILDVREPHEYEIAKIDGSKLIPLGELESLVSELDPAEDYVVHCKMGGRSAKAVEFLKTKGFTKVKNLVGGINQYATDIDTSLATY